MKKTIQRHRLSDEERAEAARLRAAWDAFKERTPGVSQEWLGRETGIGGQSAVSQYLRADLALNFANLMKFASAMHIDPSTISPRLVKEHLGDPALAVDLLAQAQTQAQPAARNQKTNLSGEARELISCVARLDGTAPDLEKTFVLLSGLLSLIGSMKKAQNTRTTEEIITEAENLAAEIFRRE